MKTILLFLISILFIVLTACSNDDNGGGVNNNPPESFNLLTIENNATNVDLQPIFTWEASVDDEDVTYTVFLDTNSNPSTIIASDLTSTTFSLPTNLERITNYYWKVVATDTHGERTTSSEVFNFTTLALRETLIVENAAFSGRSDHLSAVFDDKIWVVGGDNYSTSTIYQDVWYSEDGSNWTMASNSTPFTVRSNSSSLLKYETALCFIDSFEKEVYFTYDGNNWYLATSTPDFPNYTISKAFVFNNKLWLLMGENIGTSNFQLWSSTNGVVWNLESSDTGIVTRSNFDLTVYNNEIWLTSGFLGGSNNAGDLWKSNDGVNWTLVSEGAAQLNGHKLEAFDDILWILFGGTFNAYNYSKDGGITWEYVSESEITKRKNHTTVQFNDAIWLIGGRDNATHDSNDVWRLD